MFPGFGKDRKKDLQQKDWMMCHVLSSKQKFRKFKSMLNRILIQISNSKKTCHPLSVAAALSIYFVGGKMLGCFLFSRFVTQKRWAYISQRCLRRLFEGSDGWYFAWKMGMIEFLEGDVGCPSSVDKDVCAEPLMKSCFRKIFWIPVWYPPNRNEQRWYEFKCFNTIQLYCFLLAFSSCILFWIHPIVGYPADKKSTFLTPVLLREEGSPEDASCCLSRCRFFGAEIAGWDNEKWWTMMIVYDSWW